MLALLTESEKLFSNSVAGSEKKLVRRAGHAGDRSRTRLTKGRKIEQKSRWRSGIERKKRFEKEEDCIPSQSQAQMIDEKWNRVPAHELCCNESSCRDAWMVHRCRVRAQKERVKIKWDWKRMQRKRARRCWEERRQQNYGLQTCIRNRTEQNRTDELMMKEGLRGMIW